MSAQNTMPTRPDFLSPSGMNVVILTRAELSERLPTVEVEEINADFPGDDPLCFCWSGTSRWEGGSVYVAEADDFAAAGR
jgi:hypothetical protein